MKKYNSKWIVLAVMVLAILAGTIGGTVAYLTMKTDPVENKFEPANSKITIVEEIDGTVKKSIKIKNDSDFATYIRVAVVGNYTDADGAIVEAWNNDIPYNGDAWEKKSDGFYYCKEPVDVGKLTSELLKESIGYETLPEGAEKLVIDVLAQAIQAEPASAVSEAWGYTPAAAVGE